MYIIYIALGIISGHDALDAILKASAVGKEPQAHLAVGLSHVRTACQQNGAPGLVCHSVAYASAIF